MKFSARLSLLAASIVAGVFAFWGGWARRWMSDDGLIVLRTVRNLLAGNGPVFNMGERVEANTSTLWQYMIAAVAWVTGGRLEDIATALALTCTVLAAVIATYASGVYWQHVLGRAVAVIPFGVLVYFALPPARDFATSGLEWGLALFWLAAWWALLVEWATPARRAKPPVGYLLAFWCGLSWLVRPEFALYGGITGIVLLVYAWRDARANAHPRGGASPRTGAPTFGRRAAGILAAALPLPAAYQLFRMGYYGLLTPHTAVAKSASGAEWAQGWGYFRDLNDPYALILPLAIVALVAGVGFAGTRGRRKVIVLLCVGSAVLHTLYVLRVGGDFMHGRMLLLPLFALLMPAMSAPLTRATAAAGTALAVWATVVVLRGHDTGEDSYNRPNDQLGIVDERDFWTAALRREPGNPPMYAEDFLTSPMMRNFDTLLEEALDDDAAQINLVWESEVPLLYNWYPRGRVDADTDLQNLGTTVYWINLGMTSMNAPLEARILDTVGLATPLAARSPRDPDGRVGHDKQLHPTWQVADTAADLDDLPPWISDTRAKEARAALRTPDIAKLLATSREPMSWSRFWKNVRYSLGPGRSFMLEDAPSAYLDPDTLRKIREGEDVGLDAGHHGPQIAWPVR